MRRTGPLGPTLRRLRGARQPAPALAELVASIEAGRTVPSEAGLRSVCEALGLDLVAEAELQRARVATAELVRANPWMVANRRAG